MSDPAISDMIPTANGPTANGPIANGEDIGQDGGTDLAATARWLDSRYGYVSNLAQTLAHAPGALTPWLNLEQYCRQSSDLSERQRMLIILVAVRDVSYCWPHYQPLARAAGLSEDQISLIQQGRVPQNLSTVEQVVCRIANEIVLSRQIPHAMYDDIVKLLPSRQIVDVAVIASFYMAMGALSVGLAVEIEDAEALRSEQAHYRKTISLV